MPTPAELGEVGIVLVVGGLVLAVGYRLLTGSINTSGLLSDKTTGEVSPERIQLLVTTLGAAGLALIRANSGGASAGHVTLVPVSYLALLGGSQAFYLWRKLRQMNRQRSTD